MLHKQDKIKKGAIQIAPQVLKLPEQTGKVIKTKSYKLWLIMYYFLSGSPPYTLLLKSYPLSAWDDMTSSTMDTTSSTTDRSDLLAASSGMENNTIFTSSSTVQVSINTARLPTASPPNHNMGVRIFYRTDTAPFMNLRGRCANTMAEEVC